MKFPRSITAGVIAIAMACPAGAELGPIVVTPSAIEQPRAEANTSITVIDRRTIERSNARSVAELLRGQAGLHVSDLFGDGSQATVDLRGFGPSAASNTLLLVNGRRLNNSSDTAAPDLSGIAIDEIERIEILQGSAGVLYGNQAVGGVVNIIRKPLGGDRSMVKLRAGSDNAAVLQASLHRLIGQARVSLTASDYAADNYRDHNEVDRQDLRLRAARQFEDSSFYVELETSDEHYQTPGALLAAELEDDRRQSLSFYSDDYFDTRTDLLRLGMKRSLDDDRAFTVDLSKRIDRREFIQSQRPNPGSVSTQDRDTGNIAASYQLVPRSPRRYANIVFGVELEQTDYELLSAIGPQAIDQRILDFYLSSQWLVGRRGRLDAGVRFSDNQAEIAGDAFDDSLSVASLGYSWSRQALRLFLRADQNFRYPTVEEHTSVPFGSAPGLKTQRGISVELGSEYQRDLSRYRATLYSIRLDDEIGFDSSDFSNLNIDQTERLGLLFETSHQFGERLTAGLGLTLLDAEITGGPFEGNQLPLVAEETIRVDLSYEYDPSLVYSLELIAVGKQVFGGDFENQLDKLPAYEVVNVHATYEVGGWDLSARINNLVDERYSERGSQFSDFSAFPIVTVYQAYYPAPERNYWLSAGYRF